MITVTVLYRGNSVFEPNTKTVYGFIGKAKTLAYLSLMRSCLEYCNVMWTLRTSKNIDLIKSVLPNGLRVHLIPSCYSGQNLVGNVSESLGDLPWSCDAIMFVLCCFMLYLTILLQLILVL